VTRRHDIAGEWIRRGWEAIGRWGAIGPESRTGKRFGRFGAGSIVCFPTNTVFNERYIHIGSGTMIGPSVTLSAGMVPGQQCLSDPVVRIGDRCLIGKGSGIVGHYSIDIGDDVWTGHHVYITDQNHGYADVDLPISRQTMPERPVSIGDANSVVTGTIPDFSVAVGNPARVIKRYVDGEGWVNVD
jgi:acetyltransferase-like isoleucine patch superfamily enzyme